VRTGMRTFAALAVLLGGLLAGFAASAQAPSAPAAAAPSAAAPPAASAPSSDGQAAQDLNWLISILQDDARREALLKELQARTGADTGAAARAGASATPAANANAPAQAAPPQQQPEAEALVVSLSQRVRDASERALRLAASIGNAPDRIAEAFRGFSNPAVRTARLDAFLRALGALVAGLVAEWIASRLLLGVYRRIERSAPVTIVGRAVALITRGFIDVAPVGVFVATAVIALGLLQAPARARLAIILLIYAHIGVRAALILARIAVAPGTPNLRLFAMTEETAQYLYIWVRRLAIVAFYGTFLAESGRFFGVTVAMRAGMLKAVGTLFTLLLIIVVLQNRAAVSRLIANERTRALLGVRKALADVWHILAILYLVGLFGVWLFDVRGGFGYLGRGSIGTLVVIGVASLLIGAMKRIVARAFRLQPDVTWRFPGLEARANRYLPLFREAVRVVIWLFAVLLILQVWGVRSLQWLTSTTGVSVVGTLIAIGLVLLVALVIWESFAMALERYAARLTTRGKGGARARTLLPLFRTTAFIVLTVLAGLVILTQVGINITPLLAGAGVVGLAVGFGSQKLVQDVINGVFMLIEDTISVGDVVDLGGGHAGAVESISIRTIRLRDGNGTVHTIPFSEVKTVNNMTRDFAKGLFEVEVAYREDIERVIAAMKEVGESVSNDKALAPVIIEPFSIIGVDKVKGSGVVVLGQISTLPGKQWDVSRAFNRALKHRFTELGIEMPSGKTTVYIQGVGPAEPPPARQPSDGKEPDKPGTAKPPEKE
jgi:moderate conductance mechanosensitive channel